MFIPLTEEEFVRRVLAIQTSWEARTIYYFANHPSYQEHVIAKKPAKSRPILISGDSVLPGKVRILQEPCPSLKRLQQFIVAWVLNPAADCLLPCAHGCVPGRSVLTNAQPHVGARFKIHMDLKDFFPSVSTGRVYGLFHKIFRYPSRLAWLLAHLTTYKGALPQGAPTSPMIANLVALRLDRRLVGLAHAVSAFYTRYVDDLTFSFRRPMHPTNIQRFLDAVQKIVQEERFEVNAEKTSVVSRKRRMVVTGVVVNTVAAVPKEFRGRLRAALHQHRRGDDFAVDASIAGRLAYTHMIRPAQAAALERAAPS